MSRDPVAIRYAQAMFELAKEQGNLELINEELKGVSKVFTSTDIVNKVFKHPKVSVDEKKTLIRKNFENDVSEATMNLLFLLIDNNREAYVTGVAYEFKQLAQREQGISEADVYSAKPLSPDEEQAVADTFAKREGIQQLIVKNIVDESIIGGVKVRIGDRIYDASVANKLNQIQQRMMHGNVSR
ncbi:F0F1 ATP synthase subunit delta [Texcoconibacillus texcoconensis]|uniref:ATP synthase subunit delta n=1 Tax=Texcoconibacillus texcoconensis TaxID=1095777 RepID=A0A840QRY1_9BACI|nr:F0F1 ATP synthase subunit delta [Texcoconibacillus texcoconensis]MBB5174073.1 F-type H+-transporting ATPase subunit delta [Texcoconibacillus texcoconensis]